MYRVGWEMKLSQVQSYGWKQVTLVSRYSTGSEKDRITKGRQHKLRDMYAW